VCIDQGNASMETRKQGGEAAPLFTPTRPPVRAPAPKTEAKPHLVGVGVLEALGALHVHEAESVVGAAVGVERALVALQHAADGVALVAVAGGRVALVGAGGAGGGGGDGAVAALNAGLPVVAGVVGAERAQGRDAGAVGAAGGPAVAGGRQTSIRAGGLGDVGEGGEIVAASRAGDGGGPVKGDLADAVRVLGALGGIGGANSGGGRELVAGEQHCRRGVGCGSA
jgi:hypothetical protein